jgi:uncharacterized protein YacL
MTPETKPTPPLSFGPAASAPNVALQILRILVVAVLVILGGYAGFVIGGIMLHDVPVYRDAVSNRWAAEGAFTVLGLLIAFLVGLSAFNKLVQIGERLKMMQPNEKVAVFLGILMGLLLTLILSSIFHANAGIIVLIGIALVYLSVVATTSMKDEFRLTLPSSAAALADGKEATPDKCKILDTNVIIDGRIADICRAGFIEGLVYVPGFVLDELQHIADSPDSLKRARGRRGLDILNQMRTELKMMVRTYDSTDPNDRDEVDAKLVKLAKAINGKIVTNDFNLNKVAELQGVEVLNINELANALKPVVLPGEEMTVTIIKEGKEMNQGVAYLDDGTMIVVEGGRRRIGETLDVTTSSVLQTAAGKMIFATIREPDEEEDYDRNSRAYPRSGPRRKVY